MNQIPKIFVNKIDKINNNKEVFYSLTDKYEEEIIKSNSDIQSEINRIFKSSDFVYKKKLHIKTKDSESDYTIISKSYEYLLTIEGKRIPIKNIIEIY